MRASNMTLTPLLSLLITLKQHKKTHTILLIFTLDRGNVGVVLFNFGKEDFHVEIGDRIAQLILEQISMVPAVQVEELTETERGAGGFGSTGVAEKKQRTISPANPEGIN